MSVRFDDNSINVKAALNDVTKNWLEDWSNEIVSHAQRNCQTKDDEMQLKGSYRADVDREKGIAHIGTPLESGYWEEWGTGEHAAHGDGRKGWWVYIEGGSGYKGETNHYNSREEAESAAAYIKEKYGKIGIVTNGRKPNYTLEKAFKFNKPKAIANLERRLKEGMD